MKVEFMEHNLEFENYFKKETTNLRDKISEAVYGAAAPYAVCALVDVLAMTVTYMKIHDIDSEAFGEELDDNLDRLQKFVYGLL